MNIVKVDLKEEFAHKYQIALPKADFEKAVESRLQQVAPKVKMDGFRDGNVPVSVIREKHGNKIKQEVLAAFAQQAVRQVLNDNKELRPVGAPRVHFTKDDADEITFDVDIDTAPEVEVRNFSAMKITRPQVQVPDKTVTENLQALARRTAPVEEALRKSADGDVIVIDYQGTIEDEKQASLKAQGYRLGLGDGVIHNDFERNLTDLAAGDKKSFSVSFPDTHTARNVAGKTVAFEVEVKKVLARKEEDFKIDEALAQRLKHKDLEGLKSAIVRQIENGCQPAARQMIKRQVFDWFDENYSFPLPQRLIEAEFADIWQRVKKEMAQREVSEEKFADTQKQLREQYRSIAERRLKTGLILSEIARQNNITVDDETLLRSIKARIGAKPNAQQKQLLARIDKNPQSVLAEVRPQVIEENVVDHILSKVSITNESVSLADMLERARELNKETQLHVDSSVFGESSPNALEAAASSTDTDTDTDTDTSVTSSETRGDKKKKKKR